MLFSETAKKNYKKYKRIVDEHYKEKLNNRTHSAHGKRKSSGIAASTADSSPLNRPPKASRTAIEERYVSYFMILRLTWSWL